MKDLTELKKWRSQGWKNPFWELVRYYCSLRGKQQDIFLNELRTSKKINIEWWDALRLNDQTAENLLSYLENRKKHVLYTLDLLRTEEQAIEYCKNNKIEWGKTSTQNKDHHQSSKALIATVTSIAKNICLEQNESLESNPQKRCMWYSNNHLHVTARNLDGAIPSLNDPYIVWEIKEYWGKTSGGSKMSDAVYECHLVGKEIRDFEERSKIRIAHVVFLDGKDQWEARKSDLARFIDLYYQGLIDHLIIGSSVENEWSCLLNNLIQNKKH